MPSLPPVSEGFRRLADENLGKGLSFAQTSLLRRLEPLLDDDEEVTILTVGCHGVAGPGVLMITPRRCAYCVRRLGAIHQLRNYVFTNAVRLFIDRSFKTYALRFYDGSRLGFSILLNIVPDPPQEEIVKVVVPLVIAGGGSIESDDALVQELVEASHG